MRFIDLGQPINRASPLNYGLVSWWSVLNQGPHFGGARLLDLANRNHGTLTNGPTWSGQSHPGGWGSVLFDGVNDEVTGSTIPLDSNNWTVSAWIMPVAGAGHRRFLGWADDGPTLNVASGASSWRIVHALTVDLTASSATVTLGVFQHVVITRSAATARVFSNGVKIGENTSFSATYTANTTFSIGSRFRGEFTNSFLDDIRFYSRGLSESEVAALYRESLAGHPTTLNWHRPRIYFDAGGAPSGGFRSRILHGGNVGTDGIMSGGAL
jgi:hypothetical protein